MNRCIVIVALCCVCFGVTLSEDQPSASPSLTKETLESFYQKLNQQIKDTVADLKKRSPETDLLDASVSKCSGSDDAICLLVQITSYDGAHLQALERLSPETILKGDEAIQAVVQQVVMTWDKFSRLPVDEFRPRTREQSEFVWTAGERATKEVFVEALVDGMQKDDSHFVKQAVQESPFFRKVQIELHEDRGAKSLVVDACIDNQDGLTNCFPAAYYPLESITRENLASTIIPDALQHIQKTLEELNSDHKRKHDRTDEEDENTQLLKPPTIHRRRFFF